MKTPTQKVDRGQTMAEMWDGYQRMALPFSGPGKVRYNIAQAAFYSGALCLFNWFMVQLDDGTEPTNDDMDRVSKLESEIETYFTRGNPPA
jgi:hypothetical protein